MLKILLKKRSVYYYFTIIILSISLNGCGFALKRPQPLSFHEVQLEMAGCPHVENVLHAYLVSHQIKVYSYKQEKRPLLVVQCPTLEKIPLVYDGEGQLRRQRLIYQLNAEFTMQDQVPHKISLKTVREQQLNSDQSLGDESETHMIIREMQNTLFHQLMNQLARIDHADNLSHS